MSYCRFGWDGSDVYIINTFDNIIECVGCRMTYEGNPEYDTFMAREDIKVLTPLQQLSHQDYPGMVRSIKGKENRFSTPQGMLEHIAEHRRKDHHVPTYVDERLNEEIASKEGGQ